MFTFLRSLFIRENVNVVSFFEIIQTIQTSEDGETPIPSTFIKQDYIMAGMDNWDYTDKSSISGTEGLHYAALVVFQVATVNRSVSKPPVSNQE
ncbi:hypothetical protein DPMN_125181 [Dreissena polymorpha]|uniref:Uncharacterized protein n=1 Tax=Dreissena polymorpha TaxID=45954 RepID=A0A9D4H0X6_DREPO|nr:hypothetical protein DPMN_125181 [Dreissena polymorpha]